MSCGLDLDYQIWLSDITGSGNCLYIPLPCALFCARSTPSCRAEVLFGKGRKGPYLSSSSLCQRKMDHQYGIAVQNKFACFFNEDEDPLEILSRQEEQAKSKKKDEGDKKSKSKVKKSAPEAKPKVAEPPAVKREGELLCSLSCFKNNVRRVTITCDLSKTKTCKIEYIF